MAFETFTPIWSHANENEKEKGKKSKLENTQFIGLWMNFRSESGVYFQKRCHLKFLLPYGPMLMKTKKKTIGKNKKKNKILKKQQQKKIVWRCVKQVPFHKSDVNSHVLFQENDFCGRTENDGRPRDNSTCSSAV